MSAITPDTQIRLLKCDLSMDEMNQLTFSNVTAQTNYFLSLTHDDEIDNCTYMRKEGIIRYPKNIDSILKYNYVMYKNNNFSNKWFYAFIEKIEFANPNMTNITIKTDVFQTWQFDIVYKKCFVEREHVNDDTIGKHTQPENIETGEFKINSVYVDPNLDSISDIHYYLASTLDLSGVGTDDPLYQNTGGVYNGVYSGSKYWRFSHENYGSIRGILNWVAHTGQLDGIVGLFMAPSFLDTSGSNEVAESNSPTSYDLSVAKTYGLDNYTPKNNKLYTFPYCYLAVTNGGGDGHIYRYEFFSTSSCGFNVKGVLAPGASIRLVPKDYNGASVNNQESLSLGKFPICNYNVDMYTNWLTQNSVNIAGHTFTTDDFQGLAAITSTVFGGASIIGSLITGSPMGGGSGLMSGITNIAQAVMQKRQHELMSNAVRGDLNNGDVVTASSNNNFKFYRMSVRSEYAKIIDQFFTMYGYSINELKVPNITGRANWNYVKTIDCNLEGNIPQEDLIELKSLFNKGITLWHNPNTFLDYSQSNGIV